MITAEELQGVIYKSHLPRGLRRTVIADGTETVEIRQAHNATKQRERKRRWYMKHRQRHIARMAEIRRASPEKARAWRKKWRASNPEKVRALARKLQRIAYEKNPAPRLAYAREYFAKNKEQRLAYMREYHAKNKELIRARRAAYRDKNRDQLNASARARRAARKAVAL